MSEIHRVFVSRNMVRETKLRLVDAVAGREPTWSFTPLRSIGKDKSPTKAEAADIAAIEALLTPDWDERGAAKALREMLGSALETQRGVLRIWIPSGLLANVRQKNGNIKVGKGTDESVLEDLAEALDLLFIDQPLSEQATVVLDEDRQAPCGVFAAEIEKRSLVELCFVEGGKTILRITEGEETKDFPLDMGGRLPMYEIELERFITEQLLQIQRALNLSLTMGPKVESESAWMEMILTNAQLPGHFEKLEDGSEVFIPEPMQRGPGAVNIVAGIEYDEKDKDGVLRKTITNPGVIIRDPADPAPINNSADAHYRHGLDEVSQSYVLTESNANASGKSREQARASFKGTCKAPAEALQGATRWLLETRLAMAEALIGRPGYFTSRYRAVADARVDLGPLSPDEQSAVRENSKAGLLSEEEAMSRLGVQDVDAAIAQLRQSPNYQGAALVKLFEVMEKAADAQIGKPAALKLAVARGLITQEEADLLLRSDFVEDEGEGVEEEDEVSK